MNQSQMKSSASNKKPASSQSARSEDPYHVLRLSSLYSLSVMYARIHKTNNTSILAKVIVEGKWDGELVRTTAALILGCR